MELDIIFWIAIAAIYLLQGFLGRKKPQQGPVGQPGERPADHSRTSDSRSATSSSEMDSALEEIRSILTGEPIARREAPPQHEPAHEPQRQPAREPARSSKIEPAREVVLPPAHWETLDDTESTSWTESARTNPPKPLRSSAPAQKAPLRATPKEKMLEPIELDPIEDPIGNSATLHPPTDIAAMRKAVVLSEILRPPVSRRRF